MTPSNINLSEFDAITFHFDGNNNDKDDIAALPIAAAIAQSAGLEDKTTFFYGNNISEPNSTTQVSAMRESATFAEKLGIDTYSYQDGIEQTTSKLVEILDSGKKVLAIEGGPMEAIYRALEQTSPENRGNVVLLSHSSWNENRAEGTNPDGGEPRIWSDLRTDFPEVMQIDIQDQNNGSKNERGFNSFKWDWLDSTDNPVLQEARAKMQNADGKVDDPSDAGMLFYAITGQETANPDDAKAFFDQFPPTFSDSAPAPTPEAPPEPVAEPSDSPASAGDVFMAENGQLVLEAESATPVGDWKSVSVDGKTGLLWDAARSSYGKVPEGQTLSYTFETDEAGSYSIAMHSGRVKSAMNNSDRYEKGSGGKERTDTGNDAYVAIVNAETGEVVRKPTKLFTGLGGSDGDLKWGTTFDANHKKSQAKVELDANTQYRLEITGRSDGYVLDRITLSNDGALKDTDTPQSPLKGSTPDAPAPEPVEEPVAEEPAPAPEPVEEPVVEEPVAETPVEEPPAEEMPPAEEPMDEPPAPTDMEPDAPMGDAYRVEAEDFELSGEYGVESIEAASGGKAISLIGGPNTETGSAKVTFSGSDGLYDVKIAYFDENDGEASLEVMQGENTLAGLTLDEQRGSRLADDKTLTSQVIEGVNIKSGDVFTINGVEDGTPSTAEHARVDYLEFIPKSASAPMEEQSEPEPAPEADMPEADVAEPDMPEPDMPEPDMSEPTPELDMPEADMPDVSEPGTSESDSGYSGPLMTFALVDAETNEIVEGYEDLGANGTIDLNGLDLDKFNVVAQVNPDHPQASAVESVGFESSLGNRVEKNVPYALFGDNAGDFGGKDLAAGEYTIKATAYTGEAGSGEAIATTDLDYSVVDTGVVQGVTLAIDKDSAMGQIDGTAGDDVISIRSVSGTGTTTAAGEGEDKYILYGAAEIPEGNYHQMLESLKQNPVGTATEYFGATHSVDLGADDSADTVSLVSEIDALPKFLLKHTKSSGRINGKGVAGENNKAYDHWAGIFGFVDIDNFDASSDKLNLLGHTTTLGGSFTKDGDFFQTAYSDQNANDNSGPRAGAAHDDTFLGLLKFNGGAESAEAISEAIKVEGMKNYVVDGLGKEVYKGDPTSNQSKESISDVPLMTFGLVNSETDEIVEGYETLSNGAEIDLSALNLEKYSVVAQVNPDHIYADLVESVKFSSNLGNQTENFEPYAMFGDNKGDYRGQTPEAGKVTLNATAYSKNGGKGKAIEATDFEYTLVNTAPEAPAPEASTPEAPAPEAPASEPMMTEAPAPEMMDAMAPESFGESSQDEMAAESPAIATPEPTSTEAMDFTQEVLTLTNEFRARNGLDPLTLNENLAEAAQDHVEDMAQDDFFSHTGNDGSSILDRVQETGYDPVAVGENIAAGQTTPEQVVQGWIESPGHRANLLSDSFTEIGVGYTFLENDTGDVNYNHYWGQAFGQSSEATGTFGAEAQSSGDFVRSMAEAGFQSDAASMDTNDMSTVASVSFGSTFDAANADTANELQGIELFSGADGIGNQTESNPDELMATCNYGTATALPSNELVGAL